MKFKVYNTENLTNEKVDLLQKALNSLFNFKISLKNDRTSIQLNGQLIPTSEASETPIDERTDRILNQTYDLLASTVGLKNELRLNGFIDLWKSILNGAYQDIINGLIVRKKDLEQLKELDNIVIEDEEIDYEDDGIESSEPSPKTLKSANILLFSNLFSKAIKQTYSKID